VPLTEQQHSVLEIVKRLEVEAVPLAGGAALIVAGFVDRATQDLDFFTNNVEAVRPFADELITALEHEGLTVETIQRSAGFVQLSTGDVLIDIAHNYLSDPPVDSHVGLRCADADIVGGKVEALFTRRVNRDVLDVAQLLDRYQVSELVQLAQERDAGFSLAITIEMTAGNKYDAKQGYEEAEFEAAKAKVLEHLRTAIANDGT